MNILLIFLIIFNISTIVINSSTTVNNLVCTDDFCVKYRESTGCPNIATGCLVQNRTHSGTLFPSITPCGCCEICLEHIAEGEYCTIGAPGSPIPNSYCGPGLTCKLVDDDEHPKCAQMTDTPCFRQQIAYDLKIQSGTLGHLMQRPECDDDGNFKPKICIPGQICYCVDEDGNRIFGEDVYNDLTKIEMNCECSRIAAKFPKLIPTKYSHLTARCLDDGSFDPLQCVGGDKCVCIHRFYGTLENDGEIYNETNGLIEASCFNKIIHRNESYMNDCELMQVEKMAEIIESISNGYQVIEFQMNYCDPNGWYKRVQENKISKYCADKYGDQINDYEVPKNSEAAKTMNCNCARIKQLIPDIDALICCPNGNFPNRMCLNGLCYCIDENGNQISKEVPENQESSLSCYNEPECIS